MELLGTLIWVNRTNGWTDEQTNGGTDPLLELAVFYPAAKNDFYYVYLEDYLKFSEYHTTYPVQYKLNRT